LLCVLGDGNGTDRICRKESARYIQIARGSVFQDNNAISSQWKNRSNADSKLAG